MCFIFLNNKLSAGIFNYTVINVDLPYLY